MSNLPEDSWKAQLDSEWDVLGPFPIHAREQHYLSPAFPLNLSEPIDYARCWPSSYADTGTVVWLKATIGHDATLQICFPNIRWAALRSTEGWAALQHHAILRTTLTIFPPAKATSSPPRLLVDLKQVSYFTLRPQSEDLSTFVPEWYAGNIYDMERAVPHAVELPSVVSILKPTKFDLFVSGDYEIRLFGDPLVDGGQIPVQQLGVQVSILSNSSLILRHSAQDVYCDFVSGYAFGDCIGISLQSVSGWLTVNDVRVQGKTKGLSLTVLQPVTIAPTQTRIIPIVISQQEAFFEQHIVFDIVLESADSRFDLLSVAIQVKHHTSLGSQDREERTVVQGTYLYAHSMPTAFLAMPPKSGSNGPPILALHGAGVDIFDHDFWVKAMPESQRSWIVIPTGRTSWGLDWHGPSANDAWSSLEALVIILEKAKTHLAESYKIPPGCKVILIGHSNGGQGTWYMASRYPDRVLAAVPAAAYLKSQAYIPLTLSRSAHFIDPSLRSILESSLTPDDNDIHLTNLVDMPLLAIHGGEDVNVPVWHTREAVGLLKSLYPSQEIIFREDEGESHWYPNIFKSPATHSFLENVASESRKRPMAKSFTLTVTAPAECGSLFGWRICQLKVSGRIGRLHVRLIGENSYVVETSNVRLFGLPMQPKPLDLVVDGNFFYFGTLGEDVYIECNDDGVWQLPTSKLKPPPPGRMQAVLSSEGPITIVFSSAEDKREFSLALRIAHILLSYHRLDSAIITEDEALARTHLASWSSGNIVLIGKPSALFVKHILNPGASPVKVVGSTVCISNRTFAKRDQAVIITQPHPCRQDSFMLLILYHDAAGLERAGRLFPYRTGVAAPDWVVLSERTDVIGAAGVDAAGVWGSEWNLNEPMTWFSR